MDTDTQHGFGKFEQTAHQLEDAAARRAGALTRRVSAGGDGDVLGSLAATIRDRPFVSLLAACGAGYVLARLRRGRAA